MVDPLMPGDKCVLLNSYRTDANVVGFALSANVANIDVVTTISKIRTGQNTQCDVVDARPVIQERLITVGRVEATLCIISERTVTRGRVAVAGCVAVERSITTGRVVDAAGVAVEHERTGGRVAAAGGVVNERPKTDCRVVAACVVQERIVT